MHEIYLEIVVNACQKHACKTLIFSSYCTEFIHNQLMLRTHYSQTSSHASTNKENLEMGCAE